MVKKITLLAVGALLMSGMAIASPLTTIKGKEGKKMTEKQNLFKQNASKHSSGAMRAAQKAPEFITDVEGTPKYYYYYGEGEMYGEPFYDDGIGAEIVFGENNKVYFRDIMYEAGFGTYTEGTLDGETITIELPQVMDFYEEYGYGYYLTLLKYNKLKKEYSPVEGSVDFLVFDDGDMVLELPGEEEGEYILGLAFTDDDTYVELGYSSIVYSPYEEEAFTIPQGLETETYYYNDGVFSYPVEIGVDGDKLYMKGLSYDMPKAVAVADLNGNVASLPQEQFLGIYMGYFISTACIYIDEEFNIIPADPSVSYLFNVDFVNKTITNAEEEPWLALITEIEGQSYFLNYFVELALAYQDSLAGTPKDPFNLDFNDDYLDWYGYYSFMFTIPNVSTNDTALNSEDLYYQIFFDDELVEFEADYMTGDYWGVFEPMTDVPFNFTNGNDFYMWGPADREVGVYVEGLSTIGVQSIYKYNDTVTKSFVVTLDLETGDVTTGVDSLFSNNEVVSSQYFNINGQQVNNPDKGIYLKRMTLSNGETVTKKVIRR